jgi:multiple sugar transport system substrate-binding protein
MRKKQIVLFVSIAMLSMAALSWAGGQKEGGAAAVTVPENVEWVVTDRVGNPNAPMTLRYNVQLTYSHQTSIEARVDYLTKVSTEWAKKNIGVQLIPEVQSGSPDQILQKLLQQVASNTAPEMAQIDGMYVPLFYSSLTPLDDLIGKDEVDDYFDWAKDTMVDPKDGKLKALWFTTNAVGLWYRKDVIGEPPKTWDEWISTANSLKSQGWADGMVMRGSRNEQINYGALLPHFYGLGGKLVDADGKPIFGVGENRAKMIEAMSFWKRAVDQGLIPQRIIDIGADGDMAADASKPNQVAMILAGSWFYSQLKNTVGDDIEKWAFTFTPQKTASMRGQVAGGWNWGFFIKDPEKLKAAVDYIQAVYTSKEGMTGWCYTAGYTPTRASILEAPPFSTDAWQLAFARVVQVAKTRPGVKAYPVMTVNLQNAFQAVILGQETPEQAVDNAYKKTVSQLSS